MSRKEVDLQDQELLILIGRELKAIRESEAINIMDVPEKFDIKISRNVIAAMEKGEIYYNVSTLLKLLRAYDVDPQTFFKKL
jgi:transcriptional regulator with XRE-family HTH domain